jgi:hypothetical protein
VGIGMVVVVVDESNEHVADFIGGMGIHGNILIGCV